MEAMENKKYRASCPVCGFGLCKGAPHSQIEVNCPKCGQFLQIFFEEEGVSSAVLHRKQEPKPPGGRIPVM